MMNLHDYPPTWPWTRKPSSEFWLHMNAWSLSQFLHGEQGACWLPPSCVPAHPP